MAKLYVKQKVFSWGDKFNICSAAGETVYSVKGEVFSFGKKLHIFDPLGREAAFIHQKLFSFKPKYFINRGGTDIAQVVKEITFLKEKYTVAAFGWEVNGDLFDHQYSILRGENAVAAVSKKWLSWGDTYEIDIAPSEDEINVLCTVLIIDAVKAAQSAAASSN